MNQWSCISSPPVCLQGVDRDNFTVCFSLSNVIPRCIELLQKLLVHQSVMNMTQTTIVISTVQSPSINFMSYLSKIILILSCDLSTFPKWCFQEKTHVLNRGNVRGEFRPRQTRQLLRAVDLKGRLLSCQSY